MTDSTHALVTLPQLTSRVARRLLVALLLTIPAASLSAADEPVFVDPNRGVRKQRDAADVAEEKIREDGASAVLVALEDVSAWVRDRAVKKAVEQLDEKGLDALASGLASRSLLVVEGVIEVFARKKHTPALGAVRKLLDKQHAPSTHRIVLWALPLLAEPGDSKTVKALAKFAKKQKRNPALVAAALRARVALDPENAIELLTEASERDEPTVRAAAAEEWLRVDSSSWAAAAAAWIEDDSNDRHPFGPRRLYAVLRALTDGAVSFPDRDSAVGIVEAILARLEPGSKTRPQRAEADGFRVLRRLTGQRIGDDQEQWVAWWEAHRDEWSPPKKPQPGEVDDPKEGSTRVVKIHGMPVDSDRVLFLQDLSGGMSRNQQGSYDGDGPTRLDLAKGELARVLTALDGSTFAQLLYFASYLHPGPNVKKPLAKSRRVLLGFNEKQAVPTTPHHNRGNLYDAMASALRRPYVDTIYLLTEGAPTEGKYIDFDRFLDHFAREWRDTQIRIHVIYLGSARAGRNASFMRSLGEQTGGSFQEVDVWKP